MGKYKIILERKNFWYWSGEEVKGALEYQVDETEKKYLGSCVKFYGISRTNLYEKFYNVPVDGRHRDVVEHSLNEDFVFTKWFGFIGLDETQMSPGSLLHEMDNIVPIILVPGTYTFYFKFRLPEFLPKVIKEPFGEIYYVAEASPMVIQRDKPVCGKTKFSMHYYIVGVYNLSTQMIDLPFDKPRTIEEELGDCCRVTCRVTTNRHGYVYGQKIKAWGSITGRNYCSVYDPKVSLVMETLFHGQIGIDKFVTRILQQEPLTRKNFKNWHFVFEGVPHNLPPTNLGGGQRNIRHKFYIRMNAHIEVCACKSCKLEVATDNEIVIGTIPDTWKKGQQKYTDIKPPPPLFYAPIRQRRLKRHIAPSRKYLDRPKQLEYVKAESLSFYVKRKRHISTHRR